MSERCAIYFIPSRDQLLYRLTSQWLGYDVYTGNPVTADDTVPAALRPLQGEVHKPAHYGFHATLKAPFQLQTGARVKDLSDAVRVFADRTPSIEGVQLQIARLDDFLGLVPEQDCMELNRLAELCLREFEPWRAPLEAAEKQRRLQADLTPAQQQLLEAWGYPYVMDEYRFHMTLSGQLNERELCEYEPLLRSYLAPALCNPLAVDRITLVHQPARNTPFKVVSSYRLAG